MFTEGERKAWAGFVQFAAPFAKLIIAWVILEALFPNADGVFLFVLSVILAACL